MILKIKKYYFKIKNTNIILNKLLCYAVVAANNLGYARWFVDLNLVNMGGERACFGVEL
jgi:hypothetical protein